MDPGSLALSIGAVCGLAKVTEDLARVSWEVFRDKGDIRLDVKVSANRLRTATRVINLAVQTLKKSAENYPESPVLEELLRQGLIKGLQRDARALDRRMRNLLEKIRRMRRLRRFRWLLSLKAKVDELSPFLSVIGHLINLVMHSIILSAGLQLPKAEDPATNRYISNGIEQRKTEAAHESAELKQLWISRSDDVKGSSKSSQLQRKFEEISIRMCDFVDELRETGQVPRTSRSRSSSPLSRFSSLHPSTPLTAPTSRTSNSTYEKSAVGLEASQGEEPAAPRPDDGFGSAPSASSVGEMELTDLYVTELSSGLGLRRDSGSPRHTPNSLPSSPAAKSPSMDPTSSSMSAPSFSHKWASLNRPLSPATHQEYEVRPREVNKAGSACSPLRPKEIRVDPGADRPVLKGIIRPEDSLKALKPAMARVDRNLEENLISLSAARGLGIQIQEQHGLGRVFFGDHSFVNIIGTAEVHWWAPGDLSREKKKVKVFFWVCESLHGNIILGRPFLEAKERQSRRNSGSGENESGLEDRDR